MTESVENLCHAHIIPLWDADTLRALRRNPVRGLPKGTCLTKDGMDIMPVGYAWLDKEKASQARIEHYNYGAF